jgi:cytochrome c peroxidase
MNTTRLLWALVPAMTLATACGGGLASDREDDGPGATAASKSDLKALVQFPNENGFAATLNVNGTIDTSTANPFFQSIGTNGRSCASCHAPAQGWSITPAGVQKLFEDTDGLDPIFRTNDGSTSPSADVSTTAARRVAYSMLLRKGVLRVGIGVPADGELELVAVDDPYGHANASDLSLFRRPLPTTNLAFSSATMWDGRESTSIADARRGPNDTRGDLGRQANDATVGHAQAGAPVPEAVRQQIVSFELGLFTAQSDVRNAGVLTEAGATGGVAALSTQATYFGINDVVTGDSRTDAPFDPQSMTMFTAWASATGAKHDARQAIARGQALFNTKPIAISGVRGVNDVLGAPTLNGTCTTCHDAPNVGNHSVRLALDLGLTDASRRTPDMPLYTFCKRQVNANGSSIAGTCDATVPQIQTTDPGRALITGKWSHIATFKGPILRGLSARAPYFHNGSAATLAQVVGFYDSRFTIGLSAQEKNDLTAFLGAL